ncbi:choice-of-anchor Q domain-containing protein [Edaphobacter sp.]|uniref:choice-of-anchor Q domain-containing protein n=1 Tax=Edaphobacter sp. TaxID=1934404 RepID=UPI002DB6E09C|nr:choice-of-anchor Q domain-containing protein [Edaphobacter sp.]HEU5340737.1 choice-of-anchor Q domain-containing protein [Edaphobacter sp.]
MLMVPLSLIGETWYVRPDGGTRYSENNHKGQCDGKADAAYSGKGTNQHCAFNDYRYLWDDQSYKNDKWVIAGGDTVIIRGGPWRVGFDAATGKGAGYTWCYGGDGPFACTNPVIPSGTAEHHTRILGENYASCSTGGVTNRSKLTQIFGGYGVYFALNLRGAQYVDVECLEITSHSKCIKHGDPMLPRGCSSSTPIDDFDSSGIATDQHTHDLYLQDLYIHGHTDRGVKGPIGGVVTAERVDIAYNGMAGWDFDDGNATPSVNGVWNFKDSTIEWSGCNQIYPGTGADTCYGQSNGGYGDGVGTPPGMCLSANIDHSTFRYNVQDGLDLGHIDTGSCSLRITNSTAYGNSGGTFKWGPNENPAVVENNTIVGNCMRLSAPIAGAARGYNAHLGDFCRAGDAMPLDFRQGGSATVVNNTIVTYSPATLDIQCWDAPNSEGTATTGAGCGNSTFIFRNNIVLGYDNPGTYNLGGKPGGPVLIYQRDLIGHVVRSNNLFYGLRDVRCPTGHPNERCASPQFVSQPRFSREQDLDDFNFHLSPSSPARGAGVRLPEVQTDITGKPRPSTGNYDLGAFQD